MIRVQIEVWTAPGKKVSMAPLPIKGLPRFRCKVCKVAEKLCAAAHKNTSLFPHALTRTHTHKLLVTGTRALEKNQTYTELNKLQTKTEGTLSLLRRSLSAFLHFQMCWRS